MGRPKGGKNRHWTTEEKLRIVRRYLDEHISEGSLAKEENVPLGTLGNWINKYNKYGEEALKNKKKTGNVYSALHTSKNLSNEERLELMVKKLTIENERLKKGYIVKGVGANKEFVTLKELNSK